MSTCCFDEHRDVDEDSDGGADGKRCECVGAHAVSGSAHDRGGCAHVVSQNSNTTCRVRG